MRPFTTVTLGLVLWAACWPVMGQETKPKDSVSAPAPAVEAACAKGLDWLTKDQAQDGSWGKTYPIAVTSFACLAYLSASAEPYDGAHGRALAKGLQFLV